MAMEVVTSPDGPVSLERVAEFDEVVDAEEPIEIRGRSFARSEVLASDPVAYREALAEYREEKQVELFETVTERFPHPIAHCLYRFLNSARTENERVQFLKDTWEAIIAIIFAIAASEIRECAEEVRVTSDKVRDFKRYLDSQNLRDRLEVVRVVLESDASVPLLRSIVSTEAIEAMIDLNTRRNQDLAHVGTRNERRSGELVAELEPAVVSLLEMLELLESVELLRYEGPTGKRNEGRFESFTGHASTLTFSTRSLSPRAAAAVGSRSRDEIIIVRGETMMSLSPMIVMRPGRGHRSDLAALKKRRVENGYSVFTFESFGVAEEFELASTELASDLDAIKALFKQAKDATT